ncbi:MAG: diguanylate cyclase [Magnetococcales bacterium]|nr:diguanylate cyclase [Magnetococcales bacterium]
MGKIGHRIMLVVGVTTLLPLMGLLILHTWQEEQAILEQNLKSRTALALTVIQSLKALMLTGSASIANSFAEHLKRVPEVADLRLMRLDGHEAYQDNRTILDVNWNRGELLFTPRDREQVVPMLSPDDPHLKRLIDSRDLVAFQEYRPGEPSHLTLLTPIPNEPACHRCHGRDKPLLGVVKFSTSLAGVEEQIRQSRIQAGIMLVGCFLVVMLLTHLFIRRAIVLPVTRVTQAMGQVAGGDLTQTVPVLGRDELSAMATSFNTMVGQLLRTYTGLQHEQDKLTTIILSAREGIVVTDRNRRIVLVNPSAERLLDRSMSRIVQEGFMNLVGDADTMASLLSGEDHTHSRDFTVGNRILNIYASRIHTERGDEIGSAALIRDATEEKMLEQHLRKLSYVDELTQLFNRRRMEELLDLNCKLALRHGRELSLMMFDVDHFKRFNDEYGHDQGDRVLRVLGQVVRQSVRETDLPCRFGGEEFCVILPNTPLAGGLRIAETLRAKVERQDVDGLRVTISIGVAVLAENPFRDPEQLLKRADQALYAAKRAGRNRVATAADSQETQP